VEIGERTWNELGLGNVGGVVDGCLPSPGICAGHRRRHCRWTAAHRRLLPARARKCAAHGRHCCRRTAGHGTAAHRQLLCLPSRRGDCAAAHSESATKGKKGRRLLPARARNCAPHERRRCRQTVGHGTATNGTVAHRRTAGRRDGCAAAQFNDRREKKEGVP
jgi:hypothetical protein